MSELYDVSIVGGGLVGLSLAHALRGQGLRVALLEAAALASNTAPDTHYDDRVLALAYGSRRIYEGMGLWSTLEPMATPICNIHISDRGHFGSTRLHSRDLGLPALGYVIAAKQLGFALQQALRQIPELTVFAPMQVTGVASTPAAMQLDLLHQQQACQLRTRLLVLADGGQSPLAQQLDLLSQHHDYAQTAVIANITPSLAHQHWAYERFTDSGPLALLPMGEQRCSLVWTLKNTQVAGVLSLSDAEFLAALQQRFGWRLGRLVQAGQRHAFPLHLSQQRQPVRPRLVVIGNAAHTLHPVAGQGLNLGLRDVALLAQTLVDQVRIGGDPGDIAVLQTYAAGRLPDQNQVIRFTDSLVKLFSNDHPLLALGRNLGLLALDRCLPPLKQSLIRQTTGLSRSPTRLGLGLPL